MAIADAWRVFRTIDRLLESEAKNKALFAEIDRTLADLERRVTRLESREEIISVESRAAARAGAADAMQGVILQIGERLGAIEGRLLARKRSE